LNGFENATGKLVIGATSTLKLKTDVVIQLTCMIRRTICRAHSSIRQSEQPSGEDDVVRILTKFDSVQLVRMIGRFVFCSFPSFDDGHLGASVDGFLLRFHESAI
jgi:hypothetical protein